MKNDRFVVFLVSILLCYSDITGGFGISANSHFCARYTVDTKSSYKFVTVQIGTPLVPYRLLVCTLPKVQNMNFYNVVMFATSFGSSTMQNVASKFEDRNSGMDSELEGYGDSQSGSKLPFSDSYYSSFGSTLYSASYSRRDEVFGNSHTFSKSVSFEITYSDQWSTIGRDYSRSIDGTWLNIGMEISNLKTMQQTFDSYCNPGGLGDTIAPESYTSDNTKYGSIDGFFIIGSPQLSLLSDYDTHGIGHTTVIINSNMLKYCYQEQEMHPSLLTNYNVRTSFAGELSKQTPSLQHMKRINLNQMKDLQNTLVLSEKMYSDITLSDEEIPVPKHGRNVKKREVDGFSEINNNNKKPQQLIKPITSKIIKGKVHSIPKFVVDKNTIDQAYYVTKKSNDNGTFSSGDLYNAEVIQKDVSEMTMMELHRFPASYKEKSGILQSLRHSKNELQRGFDDHSKLNTNNQKRSNGGGTGLQLKFLLNQPYSYFHNNLYMKFMDSKNMVLDVPDQVWPKICFSKNTDETKSHGLCLLSTSLVKPEYLTKSKNGYIDYFPKSMSSFAAHFYTVYGGRLFGNTIVDRSSLKVTGTYEKVHSSYASDVHEDGFYRHAMSKLVSPSQTLLSTSIRFSHNLKRITKKTNVFTPVSVQNDNKRSSKFRNSNQTIILENEEEHLGYLVDPMIKSNFGVQADLLKSNKLLLLPHFGDPNVIYIGASAIFENYGSIKLVTSHSTGTTHIFTENPVGIDAVFLPSNLDFDENSIVIFFVIVLVYSLVLINCIYVLNSMFKFSIMFSSYTFLKYKAEVSQDEASIQMTNTDQKAISMMTKAFFNSSRKPIFMKDVLITLGAFVFSMMVFFAFDIQSIVILSETFDVSSEAASFLAQIPFNYTVFPENNMVFPQDSRNTFLVTTITFIVVALLSFMGFIAYIVLNIVNQFSCSNRRGSHHNHSHHVSSIWSIGQTEYGNMIVTKPYMDLVVQNSSQQIDFLNTLSTNEQSQLTHRSDLLAYNTKSDGEFPQNFKRRSSDQLSSQSTNEIQRDPYATFKTWDNHREFKEHFLSFIFGQIMLVIFFTSCIQLSTIDFGSSFLMRLWTFLGFVIQISFSFAGSLCLLFIARVLGSNTVPVEILFKDDVSQHAHVDRSRLVIFFYIIATVTVVIWLLSSIIFTFWLLPFEFETYQSDYSSQSVAFLVSIITYMFLIISVLQIWIRQWQSKSDMVLLFSDLVTELTQE